MIAAARWARTYGAFVVVGLVLAGWAGLSAPGRPSVDARAAGLRQVATSDSGRAIYLRGCASCHGPQGEGTADGPSLQGSGAAAADFMLRTGRMPLNLPGDPTRRRPAAYDDATIRVLVDYVASLGSGPPIPNVVVSGADVARGRALYTAECASCHGPSGGGDAIGGGVSAPSLMESDPRTVGEAVRVGPGAMPVFNEAGLSDAEVADIAAYVQFLRNPPTPGGVQPPLVGPVVEGFVAVVIGLGLLIVMVRWVEPGPRVRRHGSDRRDGDAR
ncbi:MAG TPA: c-type cytochrome [Candidatus Limnocylindria bacterium]|nr:c-type cytochrome [Candidatus Limnocylindria bacterium]